MLITIDQIFTFNTYSQKVFQFTFIKTCLPRCGFQINYALSP